ncbi:hypothetical protein HZ326_24917 [Fusarium oxysporum f. sp. albedinis]|nr:hypothetical protein HZ326_24917 [Fusarium oxysporum f. sp. albedinis]
MLIAESKPRVDDLILSFDMLSHLGVAFPDIQMENRKTSTAIILTGIFLVSHPRPVIGMVWYELVLVW